MRKYMIAVLAFLLILSLNGCTLSPFSAPTPQPTLLMLPSPTSGVPLPTPTVVTATPPSGIPVPTLPPPAGVTAVPSPTTGGAAQGTPSGPYAVVLVSPGDTLTIRSGPGVGSAAAGSFPPNANMVMRTGPSSSVDGDLWVQVQKPGGGTGWVNSRFLVEYVPQATFCADTRVNTLISSLGRAFTNRDGTQLESLVSPAHGMTVYLWRYGNSVTFDRAHARWVFDTTYEHDWGMAPASGLETVGAFHEAVLPKLVDVFNAPAPGYILTCDSLGTAAHYGTDPWPVEYAGVNYYTVYKPGTPGVDLDWRYWLVGVDFVQGQPYVFALIHFQWEP